MRATEPTVNEAAWKERLQTALDELRAALPIVDARDDIPDADLIRLLEETSGVLERTIQHLKRREAARSLDALLETIRARVPEEITDEEIASDAESLIAEVRAEDRARCP
jgi:hypothetical protein